MPTSSTQSQEAVEAIEEILNGKPALFKDMQPRMRARATRIVNAVAPALLKQGAEEERERLKEVAIEFRATADSLDPGRAAVPSYETARNRGRAEAYRTAARELRAALTDNQEAH
jgi:hypothetical protein